MRALHTVGALLDASSVDDCLAAADEIPDGEARNLLFQCLERHVAGREDFFAKKIERLTPRLAHRVLSLMYASGTQAALEVVGKLTSSPHPALRCEATALMADSHDALKDQLLGMIDGLDVSLRTAAISTMVRHQVRAAGPGLVRVIEDEGFRARPPDAQRDLLNALHELHPARAESVLSGIVKQHGLMKDDVLERTRRLAAELLGEWGETDEALSALQDATARRWWNSAELREAAKRAIIAISARRLARPAGDGGTLP
jgi:hypothetical protein